VLARFVRPQAHGIHPPKPLIFFSGKLGRLIERVWRRGPFSKTRREGERGNGERSLPGHLPEKESFDFEREEKLLESPALENYEPGHGAWLWELAREWRGNPWQRVKSFFREMSGYEDTRDRLSNRKLEAQILGRI